MEQFKRLLASLSTAQRWTILMVGILAAAGFYELAHWQTENGFRPLYNSLAPEDAAVVVQKLKEGGTPYRLSSNNATISVPEDKVAELRLEMAGAGVPKSGRIGFEIFDKTNFGMTDFAEHINYRRALEGELERSVMSIAQVEQARVHISFPQESVFTEARQPAKASVLVKIRAGDALPDSAVPAITNLISSAVEGLAPESVAVLDMRGNLLNRAKRTNGSGGDDLSESALEYRHKVEQDLTAKLDSTLEPLVGAGRFRAAVSADCDLTSGEQSEESFDPTHSVMVSSQTTEDSSTTTRVAEGIPGTASNLPETAPTSLRAGERHVAEDRERQLSDQPHGEADGPAAGNHQATFRFRADRPGSSLGRHRGRGQARHGASVRGATESDSRSGRGSHGPQHGARRPTDCREPALRIHAQSWTRPLRRIRRATAGVKKPSLVEQYKSQPKVVIGAASIFAVVLAGCLLCHLSRGQALRGQERAGPRRTGSAARLLAERAREANQLARAGEQDTWSPSSSVTRRASCPGARQSGSPDETICAKRRKRTPRFMPAFCAAGSERNGLRIWLRQPRWRRY